MTAKKIVLSAAILAPALLALNTYSNSWVEWSFTPQFDIAAHAISTPAADDKIGKELLQFRSGGHILGFSDEGVLIASGTHALKVEFVNASRIQPVRRSNVEKDSVTATAIQTAKEAPPLDEVSYPNLWPGIILKYQGNNGSVVKSTYEVSPGTDPDAIRLKANVPIEIDQRGLLHYRFETGELVESRPIAWQNIEGKRIAVEVSYKKSGESEIGFSAGNFDPAHPLTIDPVLIWNTFLGSGRSIDDEGAFISVDKSGDIYIVGWSNGTWGNPIQPYQGGYGDVFVAKFNSGGAFLWNTFLGGTGGDNVSAGYPWGGLALDENGNVFILGSSSQSWGNPIRPHSGGYSDAFVAKLNSIGILQWNTFLGGDGYDYGSDIAIDSSGNSYVIGISDKTWGSPSDPFISSYATFIAKLNSSGVLQWNTFLAYTGTKIAIDGTGNMYIFGQSSETWGNPIRPYSGGGLDAFIAKLNPSHVLQWNTFLGGAGYDYEFDVAVDKPGNVVVSGYSSKAWGSPINAPYEYGDTFMAKLAPSGDLQWNTFLGQTSYFRYGLATDDNGNSYLCGTNNDNVTAAKIDSSGARQWVRVIGESSWNSGSGIAVDGSGTIYLTGTSDVSWGTPITPFGGGKDAFVAKLNSSGGLLWNLFVGDNGSKDLIRGVVTDGLGNVYVTGTSSKSWGNPIRAHSGKTDIYVALLNSNGKLQWNTFLGGAQNDVYPAISINGSGSLLIAGVSAEVWGAPIHQKGGIAEDMFLAKLAPDGVLIWNSFLGRRWVGYCQDIAIDQAGRIYVTGTGEDPIDPAHGSPNHDGLVAKWDSNGALLWDKSFGAPGSVDICFAIALDASGNNAYVAGTSDASWGNPIVPYGQYRRAFVIKYDSNGVLQWSTFLGGENGDIVIDASGSVLVAGKSNSNWGNPSIPFSGTYSEEGQLAKLDPSGTLKWNTFLGGAGIFGADKIILDPAGNMFIVYGSRIFKLSSATELHWTHEIGGSGSDSIMNMARDAAGNLFLAANSDASWGSPILPYFGNNSASVVKLYDFTFLTMTSPNGGESWIGGSTHAVTWTSGGSIANVKIEFSSDNGAKWTTVVASTANTGSYSWMAPAVVSDKCLVRISNAATGTPSDSSNAVFAIAVTSPIIGLSKTSLNFGTEQNGTPTPAATVLLSNLGIGTLNWTTTSSADWISVSPGAGAGVGVLTIGISRTNLTPGAYSGTVTITDPVAVNSPRAINIGLNVVAAGADAPPFGDFATPIDGSTVASSIPVTGWVLDDIGTLSVKIFRGTGLSDRVYIGEAPFIRGARPDVEVAYPTYPQNDRSGWGYMLLTNMLPNSGNGTFQILAYATDTGGHEVLLGSKSIICNNQNAVLPFGAIDTPSQVGTAFGNSFANFGWVLTPQPKSIPTDGSTITVWIDSLPLGHPVYNNYRADIAGLFPGYANSNGAVGYYYLNTTGYTDGVHTIAWSVSDSAGAIDGIGSRYFTIQNAGGGAPQSDTAAVSGNTQLPTGIRPIEVLDQIPEDGRTPVYIKRGYERSAQSEVVYPESDGSLRISIPEVSRITVYLNEPKSKASESLVGIRGRQKFSRTAQSTGSSIHEAYELVRGELRPLPIGASFDPEAGVLYWQPGPGFIGEYTIVFVGNDSAGAAKKTVKITVGLPAR